LPDVLSGWRFTSSATLISSSRPAHTQQQDAGVFVRPGLARMGWLGQTYCTMQHSAAPTHRASVACCWPLVYLPHHNMTHKAPSTHWAIVARSLKPLVQASHHNMAQRQRYICL
jgi:hypothetical protein